MNIRITIQYHTQWGETLVLRIGKKRYPMDPAYANMWQKELTGRNLRDGDAYSFEVEKEGKVVRREWRAHRFEAPAGGNSLVVRERWNDRPANSTFYAAAFSDVIFRRPDGVSFRNPRPPPRSARANPSPSRAAARSAAGRSSTCWMTARSRTGASPWT